MHTAYRLLAGAGVGLATVVALSACTPTTNTAAGPVTAPVVAATAPAPAPTPAAKPTTVYTKTGNGTASTPNFTTGAEWQVAYTYDCTKFFGGNGNFIVMSAGMKDFTFPGINEEGAKGADTVYVHSDPGTHALEVTSECDWTITVTSE